MKVNIYSRKSLHTSYSCILYLKKTLEKYAEVSLWSHTPNNDIGNENEKNSHSFYNCWYGKIRGIRVYLAKLQCFLSAVKGEQVLVIHDLDFFIEAYFAKKINRDLKIVHYNTEIHGSDVVYPKYIDLFYRRYADFPDLIIECLYNRAIYRKQEFKINKQIYIIDNTLPRITEEDNIAIDMRRIRFSKKLPIVIYAGGCGTTRGLGIIVQSMEQLDGKCNFLLFLDDSNKDSYYTVIEQCKRFIEKDICHIYPAIKRSELFEYMKQCDIGLNYYNPNLNINHRFASPTKIFEYMANGLHIVSTNNEGINKIIEEEKIGYCFNHDSEFVKAIMKIIDNNELRTKKEIQEIFNKKYCYEVNSADAIKAIRDLM